MFPEIRCRGKRLFSLPFLLTRKSHTPIRAAQYQHALPVNVHTLIPQLPRGLRNSSLEDF
jgi:hypothetical protein